MDLVKKRAAIQADHEGKQQYDRMYWQPLAESGDKLADRPVAFLCDDEVVVIGDDVAKIYDGLKAFVAERSDTYAKAPNEPTKAAALNKAAKVLASPMPTEIRVNTQTWNTYLLALGEAGVQVVVTDGTNE